MTLIFIIITGMITGVIMNLSENFVIRENSFKNYINNLNKGKKAVIVEVITVTIFIITYYSIGEINLQFFRYILLLMILLAATLVDLSIKKIPNKLLFSGLIAFGLLSLFDYNFKYIMHSISGLMVIIFILAPISLLAKGSLGMGDVKVFALIGAIVGLKITFTIFIGTIFLAAIYGIILIVLKKADKKTCLPMAPFIMISTIITLIL